MKTEIELYIWNMEIDKLPKGLLEKKKTELMSVILTEF